MDKVRKLISVGAVYLLFIFGFTFFDSLNLINKFLMEVGLRSVDTEAVVDYFSPTQDPVPPPPFPPPGGGDG